MPWPNRNWCWLLHKRYSLLVSCSLTNESAIPVDGLLSWQTVLTMLHAGHCQLRSLLDTSEEGKGVFEGGLQLLLGLAGAH